MARASSNEFVFPFPHGKVYVTNGYGESETHQKQSFYSLDFRAYQGNDPCSSYGAPVLAAETGQVILIRNAGEDGSYGTFVKTKGSAGNITRYAHLKEKSIAVKGPSEVDMKIPGDLIQQGQVLGILGDTGYTLGLECKAEGKINVGAHLHFEMRDQNGNAFKPEPLQGKENYTNISTAGNPYESTTIMVDPENHWDRYDGIVPYKLSYNPVRINALVPLSVFAGSNQTFTIAGENLPEDLSIDFKLCENTRWLKREKNEQQFVCDIKEKSSRMQRNRGFFTSAQYGKVPFRFEIEILTSGVLAQQPVITEITHNNARPGQLRSFTIQGDNLPGDLKWNLEPCENISYPFRSSYRQIMTCRIPRRLTGLDGKRINTPYTFNAELSSSETGFTYQYSFIEDYEIKIFSSFPPIASYGKRSSFSFVGKNVDLAQAFFIERCGDLREKKRSENSVIVECTPLLQKWFFTIPIPKIFKQGLHYFVVKDKPGGEILNEGQILMMVSDEIFISSVEPTRPILEKENTFTISGNNLPPTLSVSIDNCNNMKVHPKEGDTLRFTCIPLMIGEADILAKIKAVEKQFYDIDGLFKRVSDISPFEKIFASQQQNIEIRLPKEISDTEASDTIIIYKAMLKPISLDYQKYLIFLEHAFPKDVGGEKSESPEIINTAQEDQYYGQENYPLADVRMFFFSGTVIQNLIIVDLTHQRIIYLDLLKKIEDAYKKIRWKTIEVKSAYFTKKQLILHLYSYQGEGAQKNDLDDIVIYDLMTHEQLLQQSFICPYDSRVIFNALSTSPDEQFTSFVIDVDSKCESNSTFRPDEKHNLTILNHLKNELRSLQVTQLSLESRGYSVFEEFYGHAVFDNNNQLYITTSFWDRDEPQYRNSKKLKIKKVKLSDLSVSEIAERPDTIITSIGAIPFVDSGFNNLQLSPQGDKLFMIAYTKKGDSFIERGENRSILSYHLKNRQFSVFSENVANAAFVINPSDSIYYYQEYGRDNASLYRLMKSDLNFEKTYTLADNFSSQSLYLGINRDESIVLAGTVWNKKIFAMNGKTMQLREDIQLFFENNIFYFNNDGAEKTNLQLMPRVLTPLVAKLMITKVFTSNECLGKKSEYNADFLHFLIENQTNTISRDIRIGLIQHTGFYSEERTVGFSTQHFPSFTIPEIKPKTSQEFCFEEPFFSSYNNSNSPITLVIEQTSNQIPPSGQRLFYFENVLEANQ